MLFEVVLRLFPFVRGLRGAAAAVLVAVVVVVLVAVLARVGVVVAVCRIRLCLVRLGFQRAEGVVHPTLFALGFADPGIQDLAFVFQPFN